MTLTFNPFNPLSSSSSKNPDETFCTAVPCTHDGVEQRHDREHILCEHCSVKHVVCRGCKFVPTIKNVADINSGWKRSAAGYTCPNCQ